MHTQDVVVFDRDELDLIVGFAGCSLDEKPGTNWVQEAGGLPDYICRIARAVKKTGKTTSQAVAIAVSRAKKWASGADGVDASTRAKATKAVAQWQALKAKSKTTKRAKTLAATHTGAVLCLAAPVEYCVDIVRTAFEQRQREARKAWRVANPNGAYDDFPPHLWVKEQWTTFLIVQSDYGQDRQLFKVPYSVDKNLAVTFGDPAEVKTEYVTVTTQELDDNLSDADLQKMMDLTAAGGTGTLLALTAPATALERVVRAAKSST